MFGTESQKKIIIRAFKMAMGSSAAIYAAEMLRLDFAASAGTIAMLTMMTTKWDTVKLSIARLLTFFIAVFLAWLVFTYMGKAWTIYGIFVFFLVLISDSLGFMSTISVNFVIGTHFLTTRDFGTEAVLNELCLVLLGISAALILNQFHDYRGYKKKLIKSIRSTEYRMQSVLRKMSDYLLTQEYSVDVWADISCMEKELHEYIEDAYEYQNNTFHSHPGYYIDYFQMRLRQLAVLQSLHSEMSKMRSFHAQAEVVADYMRYLAQYVLETNTPTKQMEKLQQIFLDMKEEPLPETREEFEHRAMLFHILMDLEEFLNLKKHFAESLDDKLKELYWKE